VSKAQIIPVADEIWRAHSGRIRKVIFVHADDLADNGKWATVSYHRPPPATDEHATVSLRDWWDWVSREGAIRVSKSWRAA